MSSVVYKADDVRGQKKLEIASTLVANTAPIAEGDYSVIVADPPWRYSLRESDAKHRGRTTYPTMEPAEIMALPVGAIAATNAYLLCWVTKDHLELGFECLKSWGFVYKSIFTWVKITKQGSPWFGVGHYGRNCTEFFLVATKGKPGTWTSLGLANIPTVLLAPRGEHSAKPEEFWAIGDRLLSAMGGKGIELFARSARPEWSAWGAELNQSQE